VDLNPTQTALLLFAVSLAGALLPLHRRWSERGLHLFVAVAAGVFLGTVFLHLLPSLAGVDVHGKVEGALRERAEPSLAPWVAAMAGLLLLFALERVWLRSFSGSVGSDPHRSLWAATWIGLGMHSLSEGIALPAILQEPTVRTQLLLSLLFHKATEAFSLATVMRLARLGSLRSAVFLVLFALIGPLGVLLGGELTSAGHGVDQILTGFACGTFLYVAACDLLPEVFHGADRPGLKLLAVGVGVLATAATGPRIQATVGFASEVLRQSGVILVEAAPYLLIGFLVAGVLHLVLKPEWLTRHLSGESLRSVVTASLVGAPLPLCSCSVVPVAIAMRRKGASKGATASFLIATPETGVDSVAVSWALLDPILTVARFVGAIVSAIFVGGVVSWFVRRGFDRADPEPPKPEESCCAEHDASPAPEVRKAPWPVRVLRYAFVDMMDDLAASMLIGFLLSGVVAAAIPADLFQAPVARGFSGLLLMLLVGIPAYVCAAGSTPIAAALILKGMSPGAALVFLLASPATNVGTLVVVSRHLGRRVVLLQFAALSAATLAIGWSVDRLYALLHVAPAASIGAEAAEHHGWASIAAAALLGVLLLAALVRTRGAAHPFRVPSEEPQTASR